MKNDPELAPLGVFQEQILVAVLRMRDEAFGMNVRREIEQVTGRELSIGAVYATLDRLEEKGLLRSRRHSVDDASRRIFELTGDGARALADAHRMHERLWSGVDVRRLVRMAGSG